MLLILALVVWSLLLLCAGGMVGYRWGYTDGWVNAGRTGYETLTSGNWLSGGNNGGD